MRFIYCLVVVGATCAALPPAFVFAKEECKEISVHAGTAVLAGKTTGAGNASTCFQLLAERGTSLRLKVVPPSNRAIAFNITGVVENQDDYTFSAKDTSYRVEVYEMSHWELPSPFRIVVSVVKTPGREKNSVGLGEGEQPLSIIQGVYKDFITNNLEDDIYAKKNRGRYFAPALKRLYDADDVQACASSIEVLGQEKPDIAQIRKTLSIVEQSNDGKRAVIVSRFRNGGAPESHRFEFVKQGGLWKITDVVFYNRERLSQIKCEAGPR